MKWPPVFSASARASSYTRAGSSTRWHRPPANSIRSIFSGLVPAGITATNGSPSIRAKYASLTAVDPEDASTIVAPSRIQPLHSAYRNSDRASRCLSEPVGCTDSSFRYRSMPRSNGNGNGSRWVSALRFASASTCRTASSTQARSVSLQRSSCSTPRRYRPSGGEVPHLPDHRVAQLVAGHPELVQDLGGTVGVGAQHAEQQVAVGDDVVLEVEGLAQRQLQRLLGPGRERDVPLDVGLVGLAPRPVQRARAEDLLGGAAYLVEVDAEGGERLRVQFGARPGPGRDAPPYRVGVDAERCECPRRRAVVDRQHAEQDVLDADEGVPERARLVLRLHDRLPRLLREPFEHLTAPFAAGPCGRTSCGRPAG